MQNARSTAAISRASEGYHFPHDALVTCKLPIGMGQNFSSQRYGKMQIVCSYLLMQQEH